MSRIRLSRSEAENGDLPAVCMRCGMDAVEWRDQELAWKPDWINLFLVFAPPLYFIVAASERRYCLLRAPFCKKCANRKSFPVWLGWVVFLGLLLFSFFSLTLVLHTCKGDLLTRLTDMAILASIVGFYAWLYLFVLARETPIEATEITRDTLTLKGASEAFSIALKRYRDKAPPPDIPDDIGQPFVPDVRPINDHYRRADSPR